MKPPPRAGASPCAPTVPVVITEAFYESVTGTEAPDGLGAVVHRVVARLEAALGIGVENRERTEWVTVYMDGSAFPRATPITDADSHDDVCVWLPARATVGRQQLTYTGGYHPQGTADVSLDLIIPDDLAEAIAWGVHTLAVFEPAEDPFEGRDDLTSVSVAGEFSVSRSGAPTGADGVGLPSGLEALRDLGGRCARLAAPYRRIPAGV